MSMPLRRCFKELLQVNDQECDKLLEDFKDDPIVIGQAATPRSLQIAIFNVLKEQFNEEILGEIAVRGGLPKVMGKHIILDCGSTKELRPIVKEYKHVNIRGIKLRRGSCNFDGDSRSDIDFDSLQIENVTIDNDYDLEMFEAQIVRQMRRWELIIE